MEENVERLQQRIKALERDIATARAAQRLAENKVIEASSSRPSHHTPLSHHASENLRTYGHTEGLVFVEPQKKNLIIPEECVEMAHSSKGLQGKLAKFYVKYNLDQFASRPILHQWLENGKIFREAIERQSSKFELFFDLLFVGIIHQIADAAAEQPDGIGLAKYVLTFCPAYSIWTDVRDTVNQFGTDDVPQRLYILWIMVLLAGYSNNASSIEFGSLDEESRARQLAVRWTLCFFICAKISKVLLNIFYGYYLPLSRISLLASSFNTALTSFFFLLAIFVHLRAQIILVAVGICNEIFLKFVGVMIIKTVEAKVKWRKRGSASPDKISIIDGNLVSVESVADGDAVGEKPSVGPSLSNSPLGSWVESTKKNLRIPAINIEHHVERLGAFVTIVLGEMVANIFFKNSIVTGLNREAGRSFLALMLAFNLNWLYFDSEACREFIHALRRHWLSSALFTYIHLPLLMALLLASSAINLLVVNDDIRAGLKFFFGTGVGISIICMGTIGSLHKRLDQCGGILGAGRGVILGARYAIGILMVLLPFAHENLDSIRFLSVYVGLTAFLIAEEIITRLEERRPESSISEGH